jgi:hypothetical protein
LLSGWRIAIRLPGRIAPGLILRRPFQIHYRHISLKLYEKFSNPAQPGSATVIVTKLTSALRGAIEKSISICKYYDISLFPAMACMLLWKARWKFQ